MALEGLRGFDDRLQPGMRRPEVPAPEERFRRPLIRIMPEGAEGLLDRPGSAHLELVQGKGAECLLLILPEMSGVLEPQIFRPFQEIVAGL